MLENSFSNESPLLRCVCLFRGFVTMETVVWHSQHDRGQRHQSEANWRVSQKTYLETILSIIYEAGNCRYNELWHHLSLAPLSIYL